MRLKWPVGSLGPIRHINKKAFRFLSFSRKSPIFKNQKDKGSIGTLKHACIQPHDERFPIYRLGREGGLFISGKVFGDTS